MTKTELQTFQQVMASFTRQLDSTVPLTMVDIAKMIVTRTEAVLFLVDSKTLGWEIDHREFNYEERKQFEKEQSELKETGLNKIYDEFQHVIPGISKRVFFMQERHVQNTANPLPSAPAADMTMAVQDSPRKFDTLQLGILGIWDHEIPEIARTHSISEVSSFGSIPRLVQNRYESWI